MTIKTEDELNVDFTDAQFRTITAQKLRDFVDSKFSIGGIMACQDQVANLTTAFQAFSWFTLSSDTKGVTDDLLLGQYTIDAGADGAYALSTNITLVAPGAGSVELVLVKNGGLLPFRCIKDITGGVPVTFPILGGGALLVGDTVGVAIKASANATVDITDAQFRIVRT